MMRAPTERTSRFRRWLVRVALATFSVFAASALAQPASAYWVGPAHSGSWYSPERSGEGFTMQVLDDGSVLAIWFTYPPAGAPAAQAWILASGGAIDGDRIRFARAITIRGPRFGAAFDPAQRQTMAWGTIEFRFTGCNDAELVYAGPPAWGSGSRRLSRLASISELECGGKRHTTASGARAFDGLRSRSGAWFDPAHDGEGWIVEELPDGRATVYWFTYDDRGEQAWTVGVGSRIGERIVVDANTLPVGTRFGADFDPARVERRGWGRLEIEFTSCDSATLRYESSIAAFGSGALNPVRLTRPAGSVCLERQAPVNDSGTWSAGAPMPLADSEIATATIGSRSCAVGGAVRLRDFQCYDAATNTWSVLAPLPAGRDHGEAVAIDGDIYFTGGYRNAADAGAPNGWRYRFSDAQWEPIAELPAVIASSAAVLGGFAYFADESGNVVQFDPRTRRSRSIAPDSRAPRDHSQLVAFQGELWLIGGRGFAVPAHPTVSIYDPASETWRAGPSLNTSRSGFAAAASATTLFVAGGERVGATLGIVGGVEAIAAGDDAWTILPRLPIAVHGVGAAIHGNAFYALGGSRVAGVAANFGDVQIYRFGP